jgi:hypothetical protein
LPIVSSVGPLEFAAATAAFVALGLAIATFTNSRKDHDELKTDLEEIKKKLGIPENNSPKKPVDNNGVGDDYDAGKLPGVIIETESHEIEMRYFPPFDNKYTIFVPYIRKMGFRERIESKIKNLKSRFNISRS